MVQTPRQPAFVQIVPLTSCPLANANASYVQPSLEHQFPFAATSGSQGYATVPRRNSHPRVGMERAGPSRGHPAVCERRASNPDTSSYPYLPAEHATKEAHTLVRPVTRFEVTSPKRKTHYVPATPSMCPERAPSPPGLSIPRRSSSGWNPYPSPPNSPPSERVPDSSGKYAPESPKQSYIPSPPPSPRRQSTPAPKPRVALASSSEEDLKEGDELLSKFRRFALAARETPSDEKCIEDLMESYDDLMPSLIEEVAVDPRLEID